MLLKKHLFFQTTRHRGEMTVLHGTFKLVNSDMQVELFVDNKLFKKSVSCAFTHE